MIDGPGFDPYVVLGVSRDADAVVIQLAYRARMREAHPDVAGAAGLERAKLLNIARDRLLDPASRAQSSAQHTAAQQAAAQSAGDAASPRDGRRARRPTATRRGGRSYDRSTLDPFACDFGPHTIELRAFLGSIDSLTPDERARVNYSLGDGRSVDFEPYLDYLEPRLWTASQALRDAVSLVWDRGTDDVGPFVPPLGQLLPSGFLVANAYAQWILLGDFFREELGGAVFRSEQVFESFAARCTEPWRASVRQARYGPNEPRVAALLETGTVLPIDAAERLARSWRRNLGRDGLGNPSDSIGPGVWLPAPPNVPEVLKVSGYLAAIDASWIPPPEGLDEGEHGSFRYGLRLAAHVLALGLGGRTARDYLRPWHDAVNPDRSLWGRVRSRMTA